MCNGLAVRAPRRAPATRTASTAAALFVTLSLSLAALAPRPAAAQQADLDKLIPADALVYVAFDGLTPLQTKVTEFLDAVMPGQGAMTAGMMFMSMQAQPGMGEIDQSKPIYFSFLSSEKPLFALPIAKPADFEALMKTQPGTENMTVLAGQGYSLVSEGPIDVEALRQGTTPKTPLLNGPIRGFVDTKRLLEKYGQQLDETLAMMASMSGEAASENALAFLSALRSSAIRLDFAVTPSKSGLEFAFSTAPSGDGFLHLIARSQAPSNAGLDKFLAAIPADSVMAGSMALPAGAQKSLLPLLGKSANSAALRSMFEKMEGLTTNSGAFGLSPGASGFGGFTYAFGLTDAVRGRSLMNEAWKDPVLVSSFSSFIGAGSTMSADVKPGASAIDGVEYDEIRVSVAAGPDATAEQKKLVETIAKVYADPILVAYPPGAMVFVGGANGRPRLEQALAGYKSGGATAPAVKALPPNQTFAVAVNLAGMMKVAAAANPEAMQGPAAMLANLPPGKEYVTMTLVPVGGMAEMRLNLTSGALRELVGPMMGGMGPR